MKQNKQKVTAEFPRGLHTSVREARARYFENNGFAADGGYSARWVPLKFGIFKLYLYNSAARKRAVPLHDLHHLATGYSTSPKGEAMVAIWELASGTQDKWFAYFINLPAFAYGFLLWPRSAIAAWRRGRNSKNLYSRDFADDLLELSVAELRDLTVAAKTQET